MGREGSQSCVLQQERGEIERVCVCGEGGYTIKMTQQSANSSCFLSDIFYRIILQFFSHG